MRYLYLPLVLAIIGVKLVAVAVPTNTLDPFQQLAPPTKALETKNVNLPSPSLPSCNDMHTKNWVSGDVMGGAINAFCKEAFNKYKPSEAFFFSDEDFAYQSSHLNMTIQIPADYTFTEDNCIKNMSLIQNQCDNNPTGNPMNWKYGGQLDIGSAYFVISVRDERYVSGRCHSLMREFWDSFITKINCELFDASGTSIYNYQSRTRVDGYHASMPAPGKPTAYYDYLVITEIDRTQELAFTLGSQDWTTSTQSSNPVEPWCHVGANGDTGFSSSGYRDIDCWFSC